jgi:type II secretory pathway pseudopilin PulG
MTEKSKQQPFGWLFWVVAAVIISSLAGLTSPMVIRSQKKAPQTEATNNLRQIGLALYEFETEYGQYPSSATIPLVKAKHPTHTINLSGNSSNALFRQLFAADFTQSERMFYAKIKNTRKPDGDIRPGQALKKGEVAFAYISVLSTKGNPARIIAFAPIIPGTTRFDPKPFEGKAVALRIDNSVSSYTIQNDGHIYHDGVNLLSPAHPIWDGKLPVIHYPE